MAQTQNIALTLLCLIIQFLAFFWCVWGVQDHGTGFGGACRAV